MLRKNEFHPDKYHEYLEHHHHHNLWVNIVDLGLYIFGLSMVSMVVVLPAFLKRLGASAIIIGLLPAIMWIGASVPLVFTSFFAEGRLRHKPWCLIIGIPQRLPWPILGFCTIWFAESNPVLLTWIFLGCWGMTSCCYGFSAPMHGELIGKSIPPHRRGFFSGMGVLVGNGLGIFGGLYIKFVMDSGYFSYPNTYAVLFFSCTAALTLSYVFFMQNREPLLWPSRQEKTIGEYGQSLLRILRTDHQYRRFLISAAFSTSRVMGIAFFMTYAMKRFNLTDEVSGDFVMTNTAATLVGAILAGLISDRKSHKSVVVIRDLAYLAAVAFSLIAWDWRVMYLVFALAGMHIAAASVTMNNIIFQFAPQGRRPTYLALRGSLTAPFYLIFSLLGGWLVEYTSLGYKAPFIISMVLTVIGMVILVFFVRVPEETLPPAPQTESK